MRMVGKFYGLYRRHFYAPIVPVIYDNDTGKVLTYKGTEIQEVYKPVSDEFCDTSYAQSTLNQKILSEMYDKFRGTDYTLVYSIYNSWVVSYSTKYIYVRNNNLNESDTFKFNGYEPLKYLRVGFFKTYLRALNSVIIPASVLYDKSTKKIFTGIHWIDFKYPVVETKSVSLYSSLYFTPSNIIAILKQENNCIYLDNKYRKLVKRKEV